MNTKLIIAAVACLGLAACQPQSSETPKEENSTAAAEQSNAPAESMTIETITVEPAAPTAPAEQPASTDQTAPAAPATPATPENGASYNDQSQNLADQANAQQQTANAAADTQEMD